MSNIFDGFSATTTFPDHDVCFGDSTNASSICHIPSAEMISFLNISDYATYWISYCNNPPADSCAFGYCPNPDVASPAVRFSTYFTSLVSAILVLYSPEDVESSFFAQLLNVYSIIVAAIIAIAKHNLDKMHSVIALSLAASPLSLYLLMYVVRSMAGNQNRLQGVFGKGKILNRIVVILMLPLWAGVLSFTALPTSVWHFQQAACDSAVADNSIVKLFFIPFILFVTIIPEVGATILAIFFLTWGTAIFRMRKIIWKKGNKILPFGRMWRKIVTQYPFIQFCTVIILPHFIWVFNIEFGLALLSNGESFTATYGQLLAIFVTVPPFIQLCLLLPRVPRWFADLTWVRLMTCRRNAPKKRDNESELPLQDGLTRLTQKPGPDRLPTGETFKLDDYSASSSTLLSPPHH